MVQPLSGASVHATDNRPWWRRSRRPWARKPQWRGPEDILLARIPSLPRPVLARLTERLINRMDELTADPDLEEEPDHEDTHDAEAEQSHD